MKSQTHTSLLATLTLLLSVAQLAAQSTAFTYQGRLDETGAPANGTYDLTFALFSTSSGAGQVGVTLTNTPVGVTNGLFTVTLDFGANFPGAGRWLEIGVRTNGGGAFSTLSPRQPLTSTPYAIRAASFSGVITSDQLSGTYDSAIAFNNPANTFTGGGAGLTNVGAVTLGGITSANFWQLGGNIGTVAGTHFLGTTDNQPLELKVNGQRVLRLEDNGDSADSGTIPDGAPNLIGGSPWNFVAAGVVGAVIGGGGATNNVGISYTNSVWADFGFVGGGIGNRIAPSLSGSTITGGGRNDIGTNSGFCAIGGGWDNNIASNSTGATIAGGIFNNIGNNSRSSAIGGGESHNIAANSSYATIAGGYRNDIGDNSGLSAIGGGWNNNIDANSTNATIAGGYLNNISDNSPYSAIGGGRNNTIATICLYSAIGGGNINTIAAESSLATIAGGYQCYIGTDSDGTTIGGGYRNTVAANSYEATIAGGYENHMGTNSGYSTIGGGQNNNIAAISRFATIAGGNFNDIGDNSSYSVVGGGYENNIASNAWHAVIPGGYSNAVGTGANYAFAAGSRAKAIHPGTFVWSDTTAADFASTRSNQFLIRASGGVGIGTNSPNEALEVVGNILASGTITGSSDRNVKENFAAVDAEAVLAKVAVIPIQRWNYIGEATPHIGPVAQDFYGAFAVGKDDRHISMVDADGVALAAIQGLNQKVDSENRFLRAENAALVQRVERLEQLLARQLEGNLK